MKRRTAKILLLLTCLSSATIVIAGNGSGNASACPGGALPKGNWKDSCGNAYCSPDSQTPSDTDFYASCPYTYSNPTGYVNVSVCKTYSVSCDMVDNQCAMECTEEPS